MFNNKKKKPEPPAPMRFGVIIDDSIFQEFKRLPGELECNDYGKDQKKKFPHSKVFVVKIMSEVTMELNPEVSDLQS